MNRTQYIVRICILVIGVFAAFFMVVVFARLYFSQPPYLITLEPHDDGTVVQFIQPLTFDDTMEVSPRFKIDASISEPFQAALTSSDVEIPGAVIEHGDITILPGAFHLRFGDTLFQVLPARIVVDGKDYDWSSRPVPLEEVIEIPVH